MISDREVYGRAGQRSPSERPFPLRPDVLLATLAEIASGRGYGRLAGEIIDVEIELTDYDNWDGGIWTWRLCLIVPPRVFAELGDEAKRREVQTDLTGIVRAMIASDIDAIETIQIVPRTNESRSGITNQGRAHSANPAAIFHDGLFFRSKAEINLYVALLATGLPVMPLPVVLSNQKTHRRIEPDFIVIKRGMTFVVEVDGDRFHKESPARAQERLRHLEDEGVRVIRVVASACADPSAAQVCAADILRRIDSLLASR